MRHRILLSVAHPPLCLFTFSHFICSTSPFLLPYCFSSQRTLISSIIKSFLHHLNCSVTVKIILDISVLRLSNRFEIFLDSLKMLFTSSVLAALSLAETFLAPFDDIWTYSPPRLARQPQPQSLKRKVSEEHTYPSKRVCFSLIGSSLKRKARDEDEEAVLPLPKRLKAVEPDGRHEIHLFAVPEQLYSSSANPIGTALPTFSRKKLTPRAQRRQASQSVAHEHQAVQHFIPFGLITNYAHYSAYGSGMTPTAPHQPSSVISTSTPAPGPPKMVQHIPQIPVSVPSDIAAAPPAAPASDDAPSTKQHHEQTSSTPTKNGDASPKPQHISVASPPRDPLPAQGTSSPSTAATTRTRQASAPQQPQQLAMASSSPDVPQIQGTLAVTGAAASNTSQQAPTHQPQPLDVAHHPINEQHRSISIITPPLPPAPGTDHGVTNANQHQAYQPFLQPVQFSSFSSFASAAPQQAFSSHISAEMEYEHHPTVVGDLAHQNQNAEETAAAVQAPMDVQLAPVEEVSGDQLAEPAMSAGRDMEWQQEDMMNFQISNAQEGTTTPAAPVPAQDTDVDMFAATEEADSFAALIAAGEASEKASDAVQQRVAAIVGAQEPPKSSKTAALDEEAAQSVASLAEGAKNKAKSEVVLDVVSKAQNQKMSSCLHSSKSGAGRAFKAQTKRSGGTKAAAQPKSAGTGTGVFKNSHVGKKVSDVQRNLESGPNRAFVEESLNEQYKKESAPVLKYIEEQMAPNVERLSDLGVGYFGVVFDEYLRRPIADASWKGLTYHRYVKNGDKEGRERFQSLHHALPEAVETLLLQEEKNFFRFASPAKCKRYRAQTSVQRLIREVARDCSGGDSTLEDSARGM